MLTVPAHSPIDRQGFDWAVQAMSACLVRGPVPSAGWAYYGGVT